MREKDTRTLNQLSEILFKSNETGECSKKDKPMKIKLKCFSHGLLVKNKFIEQMDIL